jgi:rhodanese-related sulfurtransferase
MASFLLRAFALLLVSAAAGLGWNAVRAEGIDLGRDYFPLDSAAPAVDGEEAPDPRHDFQMLDLEQARTYWELSWDANAATRDEANGIFFLDARRPASFEAGHLPGAFLADPYAEETIPEALAARLREEAFAVIVYCNGGTCEDSLSVAFQLKFQHQVPEELLFVYEGGWKEWTEAGLPSSR